ncbi:hypothetical protein TREES_T100000038 [Tupaia chinensis]|uniref:Uncharacterized protein n=1 Tax=Tupaia chinensis TaxID=246437 RepID=L9LBV6_TUPCH|nr:hypothetical protein TREES_T100000038 [Tupaia chinensis]
MRRPRAGKPTSSKRNLSQLLELPRFSSSGGLQSSLSPCYCKELAVNRALAQRSVRKQDLRDARLWQLSEREDSVRRLSLAVLTAVLSERKGSVRRLSLPVLTAVLSEREDSVRRLSLAVLTVVLSERKGSVRRLSLPVLGTFCLERI